MAISFALFSDSGLTVPFPGPLQITDYTNLSNGSQVFDYYFGSPLSLTTLQSVSNPGVDNIVLTPTYILPEFEVSHVYSLGESIIPTSPNGYRYEVTTAGTSDSSEPSWGTTLGGVNNSGTVDFTLVAEDSPTTEITLGLTEADLAINTPGAPLSLGPSISSAPLNAIRIWIKIVNTITNVSESFGTPEYGLNLNLVREA